MKRKNQIQSFSIVKLILFFNFILVTSVNAQLINPNTDGGFENGATFGANGWTAVNGPENKWYVGTASKCSGANAMYVDANTTAGTANTYNLNAASVSHAYKDIQFPSCSTQISLSFFYKVVGQKQGGNFLDYLAVYLVPTSTTPVAGTQLAVTSRLGTYQGSGTASCTSATIALPGNIAGTTQRLVFSWINDASGGSNPPAMVDNISVTAAPAALAFDEPCGALPVALGNSCNFVQYNNTGCTPTSGVAVPTCGLYGGGDVWFTTTIPASGRLFIDGNVGVITDGSLAVYIGGPNPATMLEVACDDDASANGLMPFVSITELLPGTQVWVRFWEYGGGTTGLFSLCFYTWNCPNGTQPAQPTIACYESAIFNGTTCQWDVTGTQPAQPSLACYESATFNGTTCHWDVTGTQPAQPLLSCYESATFNGATCQWDVTGTQPAQPTLACYESATFNDTTCQWDVNGTTPAPNTIVTASACDSYFWVAAGLTYTQTGTFTLISACDTSILQLTINPSLSSTTSISSIASYTWTNGMTYTASGVYVNQGLTANGCSQIDTLLLTIINPSNVTISPPTCYGLSDGSIQFVQEGDTVSSTNPGLLISEIRTDVPGNDSPFEWVELVATRAIDFSSTPYTLIVSDNGVATTKGWVQGGVASPPPNNATYAFQINSGQVNPGNVVYVGGSSMAPNVNRLRTLNTASSGGDGGIGGPNLSSGVIGNGGGVADGIAVFNLPVHLIDSNTVPVDAIFFGTSVGTAALSDTSKGFALPNNDRYAGGRLKSSSYLAPDPLGSYSIRAQGTFDRHTAQFESPRTWSNNNTVWNAATSALNVKGYSYLWSTGATTSGISQLSAGTYTLTLTQPDGTVNTFTYLLGQPDSLHINLNTQQPVCDNNPFGNISTNVSGGTAPYNYQWSNGSTSSAVSTAAVGAYTVLVSDSQGCTASASASIASPDSLKIQLSYTPIACFGGTTTVNVQASGGTAPYTGTGAIANLSAGVQTFAVSDANGCATTASLVLSQPSQINTVYTVSPPACFGDSATVVVSASGGTGLLSGTGTYQVAPGTSVFTVSDANACTGSISVSVDPPPALLTASVVPAPTLCFGDTTSVQVSIQGGTPPYTTIGNTSGLGAGAYTLQIQDAKACSTQTAFVLSQYPQRILDSIAPPATNAGLPLSLYGSNLSGTSSIQLGQSLTSNFVSYSDSIISLLVPAGAGSGSISLLDSNGCSTTSGIAFTELQDFAGLTVKLFIEGLYANGGFMVSPLVNSGNSTNPLHSDSITVRLYDGVLPTVPLESDTAIIGYDGLAGFTFPGYCIGRSYWIAVRHRNSVETWSKTPVLFSTQTRYNFSGLIQWPQVSKGTVHSITNTTALHTAQVLDNGGAALSARGTCWSTSPNPTISLSTKTVLSGGVGTFTSQITNLLPNTSYYLRSYATNSMGTVYGDPIQFTTPNIPLNKVMDVDGNLYDTVRIGQNTWLRQNLRTTRYRDGSSIANITDSLQWLNTQASQIGAWCYYRNDSSFNAEYGKLYNWYAVNDTAVCPAGWHVSTDSEWNKMVKHLISYADTTCVTCGQDVSPWFFWGYATGAATELKSAGITHWLPSNYNPTNSTNFSAMPGGCRKGNTGPYYYVGFGGYWWTSSPVNAQKAYSRGMDYNIPFVFRYPSGKQDGFSVRCVKD